MSWMKNTDPAPNPRSSREYHPLKPPIHWPKHTTSDPYSRFNGCQQTLNPIVQQEPAKWIARKWDTMIVINNTFLPVMTPDCLFLSFKFPKRNVEPGNLAMNVELQFLPTSPLRSLCEIQHNGTASINWGCPLPTLSTKNKNPPALFCSAKNKDDLQQLMHSYTDKHCDILPRNKSTPNWNEGFAPNNFPMKVQYKKLPYSLQGHQIHQKLVNVSPVQPTERNVKNIAIHQTQSLIHSNNGTHFPISCPADEILYISKDNWFILDNINQSRPKMFPARHTLESNTTMDIEVAVASAQVPYEVDILTGSSGPETSPI